MTSQNQPDYDVAVIGAGMGVIYATDQLLRKGFTVHGIEAASDVGGVWFHNRYPGARVDIEPYYYCLFDPEVYREWVWTERYPAQAEILAYLNWVADKFGTRDHYEFNTWMTGAIWDPALDLYVISTDKGSSFTARYLVMATGQLSKSRKPQFAGLDDFAGEWFQTAHWPTHEVDLSGKRVAVIGTGSTAIQTATAAADVASELMVFQRTANFSVPAHNRPIDREAYDAYAADPAALLSQLLAGASGTIMPTYEGLAASFTAEEQ
ncbi:hypothetical protein BH09ACT10_BH09ACT10_26920 [soil metagenome]